MKAQAFGIGDKVRVLPASGTTIPMHIVWTVEGVVRYKDGRVKFHLGKPTSDRGYATGHAACIRGMYLVLA